MIREESSLTARLKEMLALVSMVRNASLSDKDPPLIPTTINLTDLLLLPHQRLVNLS